MTATTVARERPILFSGPMVRALLDDRKTQTRRVLKPQPYDETSTLKVGEYYPTVIARDGTEEPGDPVYGAWNDFGDYALRCPYGQPGDRLWVREAWTIKNWTDKECEQMGYANAPQHPTEEYMGVPTRAIHRVGWCPEWDLPDTPEKWHPSIHLPRWASRITLEITEVRVERVSDISERDAKAEGVTPDPEIDIAPGVSDGFEHRIAFARLWDHLNASRGYSWNVNPWVWVIGFKRVPQ